jgi:hypothetical protein
LVCLLFSTRILDFLQSPDSMVDATPSNHPKLVASRVKTRGGELHKINLFSATAKTGTTTLSKLLLAVEQRKARGDYCLYPRVVQSSGGSHRQKSGYSWRDSCVSRNASACPSVVRLPGRRRNTRRLSRGISYRLARIGRRCARRGKIAFARTSINARSDR